MRSRSSGPDAPEWVGDALRERALIARECSTPRRSHNCMQNARGRSASGSVLSNTDNMALVGVLSTQLLHQTFVEQRREPPALDLRDDARSTIVTTNGESP